MELLKRKDGSKSRHGLWDSIRENKGSGKKPTTAMVKQEKKIKAKSPLKMNERSGIKHVSFDRAMTKFLPIESDSARSYKTYYRIGSDDLQAAHKNTTFPNLPKEIRGEGYNSTGVKVKMVTPITKKKY